MISIFFWKPFYPPKKNLAISYVGQSAIDNSEILPSVLVCEFMDYIDRNYPCEDDQPLSHLITRKHRLHAFSPAYFGEDKKLFSYSRQNYLAALAIHGREAEKHPFLKEPLPETIESTEIISIKDLTKFYGNPVRYFLENRLCLKLPAVLWEEEGDSEPFAVDPLSAYQIKQDLVENHLNPVENPSVFQLKKAEGVLPVGSAGNYHFNSLTRQANIYAARVGVYLKGRHPEKRNIDLRVGDYRLTGVLDNLYTDYRISYRMAKLKMNDYLNAWICHLILNAAPPEGHPQTGLVLGEDHCWRLGPINNAQEILKVLIKYYFLGQSKPLKFFARTSWEYAQVLWLKDKSCTEAMAAANRSWLGTDYRWSEAESQEIGHKICFENDVPIDAEFEQTAEDILKELVIHLEKLE